MDRGWARKSVFFHNLILRKYGARFDVVKKGCLVTQSMRFDAENRTLRNEFEPYRDYARYRTFELVVDEIRARFSKEQLANLCVAEAGVYLGDFAWILNRRFPESKLYLYDTFEGFDESDMKDEIKNLYISKSAMKGYHTVFKNKNISPEDKIRMVKGKMTYLDQCIFRKGYFPDSAKEEQNNEWVFVSLDMDLYTPILAGIRFFWPNLVGGGYMFIHDYNNTDFSGVRQALNKVEAEFGTIKKVPISDHGGTVILCK